MPKAAPVPQLHNVEKFLAALRAGTLDGRRALVSYRVGNEFTGFTDLELRGDGEARVKSTVTKGLRLLWEADTVTGPALDRLLGALIRNKLWLIHGTRVDPLLDEPRVEIELRYDDERWLAGWWLFDIRTNKSWARIRDEFAVVVHDISGGAVIQLDP
jgi:hypothetical protein